MPENTLQVLQFKAGINRESTSYANEGGWYQCDKIRFRSGQPEKLGGWMLYGSGTYQGVCRHYVEWASLTNYLLVGVGTNELYYINSGGVYYDITPIVAVQELPNNPVYSMRATLSAGITATDTIIPVINVTTANMAFGGPFVVKIDDELVYVPYVDTGANTLGDADYPCVRGYNGTTAATHATAAGVSSSWVVIYGADVSQIAAGDSIVIGNLTNTVPAPYTATLLNQQYTVTSIGTSALYIDTGVYSVSAGSGGGNTPAYIQQLVPAGNVYQGISAGWGANGWGEGGWGETYAYADPIYQIRLWSADNYGQDLVFNARDLGIYYWTAETSLNAAGQVTARATTLNDPNIARVYFSMMVPNNYYEILDLGAAPQSYWDIVTGSATGAHTVGEKFFCAAVIEEPSNVGTIATDVTLATVTGTDTDFDATKWLGASIYRADTGDYLGTVLSVTDATHLTLDALAAETYSGDFTVSMDTMGSVIDPAIPTVATCVTVTEQRHIVAFGCDDLIGNPTGGQDKMFIAWCAQENPDIWYPTQTNTAGSYRLSMGSKIITTAETRQETLIFTDLALYSMQYLGAPYVFGFNVMDSNTTIASPNAVATANNITYWMGQDKFYAYSGRVDTLPCSLRQYVFDDININQLDQVYAGTNEKYNEVWWFYPSSGSMMNDRYVVYNHLEKLWFYGQLSRTAWLDSSAVNYPLGAVPNVTDPLQPEGISVQHEVGADDGSVNPIQPISAYITTSDFDLGQGGYHFSFIKRIIPDVDFIGSVVSNPSVNITLTAKNYPGIGVNTDAMQSTTSGVEGTKIDVQVYNYTEQAWIRLRGRQIQFRIGSDDLGVRWQLGAPRIQIQADGRR